MRLMSYMKLMVVALVAMFMGTVVSGCYMLSSVKSSEVGMIMGNGVRVDRVVGPGRYTNLGFFAKIINLNCSAQTITWEDPDLWTKDKQPVRFKVTVTYARKRDTKSTKLMWNNYNLEAVNDQALANIVTTRIPRVAKQVTTQYTLDQMLGIDETSVAAQGREAVQQKMIVLLAKELDEFGVELKDVGVNDIGADENYVAQLKEKAVSQVAVEVAAQKTRQLNEQIKQEEAQTRVDLEKARRANLVAAEKSKVYQLNPQAYQLERLRLMKEMIGENDKFFFVEKGQDIHLFLDSKGVVPVK